MQEGCIFCSRIYELERIAENTDFMGVLDEYPVNPGHALVISKRHAESLFELTEREFVSMRSMLLAVREMLEKDFHPAGYSVGANIGLASGRTVAHFHLHVIPRYEGDVADPKGGIRNIKKALVDYDPR